jgi:hypothetical protein
VIDFSDSMIFAMGIANSPNAGSAGSRR